MKRRHATTHRVAMRATLASVTLILTLLAISTGCTGDNTQVTIPEQKADAGQRDASSANNGQLDTGGGDEPRARAGQHLCAAAGEAKGGGYSVVHCTAPAAPATTSMAGGGYQVDQGSLRALAPQE